MSQISVESANWIENKIAEYAETCDVAIVHEEHTEPVETAVSIEALYYKLALDDLYLQLLKAINRGEQVTEELVTQIIMGLKDGAEERCA